jgi:hypothetical protein
MFVFRTQRGEPRNQVSTFVEAWNLAYAEASRSGEPVQFEGPRGIYEVRPNTNAWTLIAKRAS